MFSKELKSLTPEEMHQLLGGGTPWVDDQPTTNGFPWVD